MSYAGRHAILQSDEHEIGEGAADVDAECELRCHRRHTPACLLRRVRVTAGSTEEAIPSPTIATPYSFNAASRETLPATKSAKRVQVRV